MSTTIDMLVARVETLEKQVAMLLKKDTVEVVDAKPKKAKKSKDEPSSEDEDKPKKKRGTNGYILFSNANRDEVKERLCVGDEKPKNTEIMKELAQMWKNTSDEEKAIWTAKAKEANVEDA